MGAEQAKETVSKLSQCQPGRREQAEHSGYSELKAPALHGAGGVRLPTLEKLLLNQLCAREGDKVSCRASRDEGGNL